MIAGLIPFNEGNVLIDGTDIILVRNYLNVGYVFQKDTFSLGGLYVKILGMAELSGMDKEAINVSVEEIIKRSGLDGFKMLFP